MTIRDAISQLESEHYDNEDLLFLFKDYTIKSTETWRDSTDRERARTYTVAIHKMILERMH